MRQSESKSAGGKLEHVSSSSEAGAFRDSSDAANEMGEVLETAQALQAVTGVANPGGNKTPMGGNIGNLEQAASAV